MINEFKIKFINKDGKEVEETFVFDKKVNSGFTLNKILAATGKKFGNIIFEKSKTAETNEIEKEDEKEDEKEVSLESLGAVLFIGYEILKLCTSHDLNTEEKVEDYFVNDFEAFSNLTGKIVNLFIKRKESAK